MENSQERNDEVIIPKDHSLFVNDNGKIIYLSLNKKIRNSEFYNNPYFNMELAKFKNFEMKKFLMLVNGYHTFRKGFKTRKAMKKYVRNTLRKEKFSQQKENIL